MKKSLISLIFLALPFVAHADRSTEPVVDDLGVTIEFLVDRVKSSGIVFIRNAREYDGERAAKHMMKKFHHFRAEIHSAEDFIRLSATRSLTSGQAYQVRLPDGRVMASADWLLLQLQTYRDRPAGPS